MIAKCRLIIEILELSYPEVVTHGLAVLLMLALLKLQSPATIWPLFSCNPSTC